ncbi:MAG TPA: glycine zipper domain-containing protein [Telluria sp.]
MSTILAGHFQLQDEIQRAREELVRAGFADDQISAFYLNQPGQHDRTPIGGDHLISPGAKETPVGVVEGEVTGGAVGAAIGAATIPVTGAIGPIVGGLVGAHVGSLYSFHKMKEQGEHEKGENEHENELAVRPAGMLIAVACVTEAEHDRALGVLRQLGAHHIEKAQGTIEGGDWTDFDPLSAPQLLR